jgi:ribose transport system permease protein
LSIANDRFLTETNLTNILDQNSSVAIIACGATLVIIAGGFDLSVGAVFGLTGVVAAKVATDLGPTEGIILGVLAGAALGAVNGVVTVWGRITSFIATLATSIVFRGLAVIIAGGLLLTVDDLSFQNLGTGSTAGLSYPSWVMIAFAAGCGLILTWTQLGRYIFAVGDNPEAARLSGVRVGTVRVTTFVISGLAAGLAGVLSASQVNGGDASAGVGLELQAIAAVVVGGTSISGGEGAIWRTLVGVFTLALITNGFNLLGVGGNYQQVVQGAIILGAVAFDSWARGRGS